LTKYSQTDRFSRGSIVESTHWMVLHRPVELAALIGHVDYFRVRRDPGTTAATAAPGPAPTSFLLKISSERNEQHSI
jgi:hypothetical protein